MTQAQVTRSELGAYELYLERTHRAHVWGVVVAGVLGLVPWTDAIDGLGWSWLLAGYFAGVVGAELVIRGGRIRGTRTTWTTKVPLVPRWLRPLPWVTLLPCLAAPMLLLGRHPRGRYHVHGRLGSAWGIDTWFPPGLVIGTAGFAGVTLLAWSLLMWRLRRLPLDPHLQVVDVFTRCASARLGAVTATALGLALLSQVASMADESLTSDSCDARIRCHYLYAAHAWAGPAQDVGLLCAVGALLGFLAGRLWAVTEGKGSRRSRRAGAATA